MTVNTIQYAFAAGEVSKSFLGRQDLEKYDMGLELARNWFVDYRGGLSTRPGTKFLDYIQRDDQDVVFFDFRYSPDDANTYTLVVGHNYMRFVQNGGYVLEAAKLITGITGAGRVTSVGHGYSTGNWIKIAGFTFEVTYVDVDTYDILPPHQFTFPAANYPTVLAATAANRIYTLATPWAGPDLNDLRAHQHLNEMRFTRWDYHPRLLTRVDHTNWSLSVISHVNAVTPPAGPIVFGTSVDEERKCAVAVTAIDEDGNESLPLYGVATDLAALNEAGESNFFEWGSSAAAVSYNIYRGVLVRRDFSSGQEVGYMGSTRGVSFVDTGILPDFTETPPRGFNPFANSAIKRIQVTNPGSDYTFATTVTITDTGAGSGFIGIPIIRATNQNNFGIIEGVLIINGGEGYVNPVVVFTDSSGTSAAATATLTEASGNSPALFTVFQQRGVYASTLNNPLDVWGSRPKLFDDFSFSEIVVEDDSYSFTLDVGEVAPIRHLIPSRGGMLIMSQSGVWLLTGGQEAAVSPINALADPQTYNGVSRVKPIIIGSDILYVEEKGSSAKLLTYNDFSRVYGGQSMTILANHLFRNGRFIKEWSWAESPSNIVWAVRNDGAILPFTFLKEQQLYAWTQCWTQGLFDRVISVQEGKTDTTYLIVWRLINGRWTKMLESFGPRDVLDVEDAWCVDAGLSLGANPVNANLYLDGGAGEVTATADVAVFAPDSVGKVVRINGGKAIVTEYLSVYVVKLNFVRPITDYIPETETPLPGYALTWTMDTPVASIGGLHHLEGETVAVLADGNVVENLVVEDGTITLPNAATRVIVGLPYECVARNLPITAPSAIIEDKRKRIVGVAVRKHETRGLQVGEDLKRLQGSKERRPGILGEPIPLRTAIDYMGYEAGFDENGQTYFVQRYPLPANVLGIIQDFEVGDDND